MTNKNISFLFLKNNITLLLIMSILFINLSPPFRFAFNNKPTTGGWAWLQLTFNRQTQTHVFFSNKSVSQFNADYCKTIVSIWSKTMSDLSNADFSLCVLQAFHDDVEECSGWNQGSIDVGLTDVALNSKRVRWVHESWNIYKKEILRGKNCVNVVIFKYTPWTKLRRFINHQNI